MIDASGIMGPCLNLKPGAHGVLKCCDVQDHLLRDSTHASYSGIRRPQLKCRACAPCQHKVCRKQALWERPEALWAHASAMMWTFPGG